MQPMGFTTYRIDHRAEIPKQLCTRRKRIEWGRIVQEGSWGLALAPPADPPRHS